jgi:phosphoglycolate phosphatase
MIGDREHDVIGADVVGIRTIGVRWGYGSDRELLDAGAAALVDDPREIAGLLLR